MPVSRWPDGGHEQLHELGHHAERGLAEAVRLGRHLAPAEDRQPLLGGDLLDLGAGLGHGLVVAGQERRAHGVRARRRELEAGLAGDGAEERVGDLHQDAGAVTGVRLGARGAAVLQVAQGGEGLHQDLVAGLTGQGGDEGHATGVVLVARVVEPLGRRERVLVGHRSISRRRRRRRTQNGSVWCSGGCRGRHWPKRAVQPIKEQRAGPGSCFRVVGIPRRPHRRPSAPPRARGPRPSSYTDSSWPGRSRRLTTK